MVVLSLGLDGPAPQCNLSAEKHNRGAGPSGRPPTTSAACALATGYTRPTRWLPAHACRWRGRVPSAGPCRASPGPSDCQCAHCAPGLTPGPQEDCAVPDHRPVPLRDCDEALPRRAARARTAPLATCGSANDRCRPITSAVGSVSAYICACCFVPPHALGVESEPSWLSHSGLSRDPRPGRAHWRTRISNRPPCPPAPLACPLALPSAQRKLAAP